MFMDLCLIVRILIYCIDSLNYIKYDYTRMLKIITIPT